MNFNKDKALFDAQKRLDARLKEINKRHEKGIENSTEEPDRIQSGKSLDELEIRRIQREQEDEN
ncbi:hypothetical protein [Sessilibacter sp. MAH2]